MYLNTGHPCLCGPGCETLSGLGGAAGYGGGKVSLPPAGSGFGEIVGSPEVGDAVVIAALNVLNQFLDTTPHVVDAATRVEAVDFYASKGLKYKHYDVHKFSAKRMRDAFADMLTQVRSQGIEVLSPARVSSVTRGRGGYVIRYVCNGERAELLADAVVVSSGRLGRRFMLDLLREMDLSYEPGFADVGVRLEFPAEDCPGVEVRHGDLKLKVGNARTYCVCPNGFVVPYSLDGVLACEGVNSDGSHSGFTNFAVLLREEGDPSALVDEVRRRQQAMGVDTVAYEPLGQLLAGAIGSNRADAPTGTLDCRRVDDLLDMFPMRLRLELRTSIERILEAEALSGLTSHARAYGPELDYALARIPAGSNFKLATGLYIAGEATGRFRGVLQSFASGLHVGGLVAREQSQ